MYSNVHHHTNRRCRARSIVLSDHARLSVIHFPTNLTLDVSQLFYITSLVSRRINKLCQTSFLKILKVWCMAGCHSFCLFFIFYDIHSSYTVHLSVAIRWGLSSSLHRFLAQWEKPPCGAEPKIELGPAFQQADALPTEPRRTITETVTLMVQISSIHLKL